MSRILNPPKEIFNDMKATAYKHRKWFNPMYWIQGHIKQVHIIIPIEDEREKIIAEINQLIMELESAGFHDATVGLRTLKERLNTSTTK